MGILPALSGVASELLDVPKHVVCDGSGRLSVTSSIKKKPTRIGTGWPAGRQGLIGPRPRGDERRERTTRPHIEVDVEELGSFHPRRWCLAPFSIAPCVRERAL